MTCTHDAKWNITLPLSAHQGQKDMPHDVCKGPACPYVQLHTMSDDPLQLLAAPCMKTSELLISALDCALVPLLCSAASICGEILLLLLSAADVPSKTSPHCTALPSPLLTLQAVSGCSFCQLASPAPVAQSRWQLA
jgi:hypothetical protein